MGRTRQFDQDQVLAQAMKAFWQHGYTATSINDLLEETHLARGSLYGAFGDKRHLFQAVLQKYAAEELERQRKLLERPGKIKKILRDWARQAIENTGAEHSQRCCLMFKTALEMSAEDQQIAECVRASMAGFESLMAGVIERGKSRGELRADLNTKTAAKFILSSMHGLKARAIASVDRSELLPVVEMILRVLE